MTEKPVLPSGLRSGDWDLPEEPSPLRHPVRLLAAAGAATVVAGVLLPWIDYGVDASHASANGLTGDTWGILAAVTACGLVAALASRSAARSQARWVQLVPALLGLATLVFYYDASLGAQQLADSYRLSGYQVTMSVGLGVLLLGSVLCAAGGVASSALVWRNGGPPPRAIPATEVGQVAGTWTGMAADLVLSALVGIGCAFAGAVLALNLTSGAGAAGLMVLFAASGGLFGATLTDRLWRRFAQRR